MHVQHRQRVPAAICEQSLSTPGSIIIRHGIDLMQADRTLLMHRCHRLSLQIIIAEPRYQGGRNGFDRVGTEETRMGDMGPHNREEVANPIDRCEQSAG